MTLYDRREYACPESCYEPFDHFHYIEEVWHGAACITQIIDFTSKEEQKRVGPRMGECVDLQEMWLDQNALDALQRVRTGT